MSKNIEKNTLLEEFLLSLTDKNWSEPNYLNVIEESSSSEAVWSANFPLGLRDLTAFYIAQSLENISIPNKDQFVHLKTQERLEEILMSYFNQFNDKLVVNKLVNFLKTYESMAVMPESIYHMSDKFWRLIEDKSIDFNYYTKRFILMSVIVPTTLFWLNDESLDNTKTKDYMKKCFKRSMKIGIFKNNIKKTFSKFF